MTKEPTKTIGCDLHAGLQQALSAMRHGSQQPLASWSVRHHELHGRFVFSLHLVRAT